jgi:hypothetical protein
MGIFITPSRKAGKEGQTKVHAKTQRTQRKNHKSVYLTQRRKERKGKPKNRLLLGLRPIQPVSNYGFNQIRN